MREPYSVDTFASGHPFCEAGLTEFDAILQSRPDVFDGKLLVTDATLWASVFGGLDDLTQLWRNVALRPARCARTPRERYAAI